MGILFVCAIAISTWGLCLSYREWKRADSVTFRVAYCPHCCVFPVTRDAFCILCGCPVMEMHRHRSFSMRRELAKNG